jgi:adenylate kinase
MTDEAEKNILLELRDSAKSNRNEQYRKIARECANQLSDAINALAVMPTPTALKTVNGFWSRGLRIMKYQPEDDPPSAKFGIAND